MKTYTVSELTEVIEKHRKWLNDKEGAERADLSYADLRYAILRHADLRGADLSYAVLRRADLRGADLSYADLSHADLSHADLSDTNLSHTNLSDANLSYADLSDANLSDAAVHNIVGVKVVSIDNIGTYNGKATFLPSKNKVWAGCWSGTLEEFLIKGRERNAKNQKQLKNIELAYAFFKNHVEEA